jgi:hypothetical protein
MASELEVSLKKAAAKIAQYVEDIATLTVETWYVEVAAENTANNGKTKSAAKTVIKLDGDNDTLVPMRKSPTGELEVDTTLFNIHQENVTSAINYRTNMMDALLNLLRTREQQ